MPAAALGLWGPPRAETLGDLLRDLSAGQVGREQAGGRHRAGGARAVRDGVTDDRRAQVPDVHLLSDVGRGVLHHHGLRTGRRGESEPGVVEHLRGLGGDPVVAQGEVDEAGPADLGLGAHVRDVQSGGQLAGHLPRRAAQPLAERQRHVGLEIRERGGPDLRVGVAVVRAERRDDGVVHPLRENLLWIGHDLSLSAALRPLARVFPGPAP